MGVFSNQWSEEDASKPTPSLLEPYQNGGGGKGNSYV